MPSNICDLLTFGADFAKIIYMTDFKIPKGYIKLKEKYELSNDQNLKFEFNALSPQGTVISVFLAKEKLDTYDRMIRDYGSVTQNLEMKKKFSLKIGEKQAYIYIIGKDSFLAQAFFEVRGQLFSFLTSIEKFERDYQTLKASSQAFLALVNFLRALR